MRALRSGEFVEGPRECGAHEVREPGREGRDEAEAVRVRETRGGRSLTALSALPVLTGPPFRVTGRRHADPLLGGVGLQTFQTIGGLIGLGILIYGTKRGFCVPKATWDFGPHEKWDASWTGSIAASGKTEFHPHMTQFRAWLPYAIIGLILVLTRIPELGLKAWLASFKLSFVDILGYQGVSASIDYLFLPGTIPFTLVAILTIGLHSMKANDVKDAWTTTFAKMKAPTIALFAAVALVSIFRGSGVNDAGMDSMPLALAKTLAALTGEAWPALASYVGGLGAFITGSNTVSDLLFAQFQWDMATQLKLSKEIIVAAQAVGGGMGNMICIHNVVAVCAVVGLSGSEGMIIKKTFWPFLLYGIIVGIIACGLVF